MSKVKMTLREHLEILDQNGKAEPGQKAMTSLHHRVKKIFRQLGYTKAAKNDTLVTQYINMIFGTQDYRCTHWLPTTGDELNGVWNRPGAGYGMWKRDEVQYEIDHVHPVNAGGADHLENFQFLSGNANQFVKCSLTYDDLLKRVDLSGALKDRIRDVLKRREELFASAEWKNFIKSLTS
tara:strand:- start:32 stop:571 length:540 start_codon:yes stop_codon:yes gene_type:complete